MELSSTDATPVLEIDASGLAHIVFDDSSRALNVLSQNVMAELGRVLDRLEAEVAAGSVRAVLVRSGKTGSFIAGADVEEIGQVVSAAEATEAGRAGQLLFHRFWTLQVPSVAAINGICLGGGTELALACRYRVASDHPSTRIGLPEVQLGILPGWGGTTRLPRLVGLRAALDMILTGRPTRASKALRMGLVDALLPHEQFRERAVEFALAASPTRTGRRPGGLLGRVLDGSAPGRSIVLRTARQRVLKETGGHYPAPLAVLDVSKKGLGRSLEASFALEAEALGRLLTSAVCRNLIHIFHLRERARKGPWSRGGTAREVTRMGVLGAGVMGGGIAQLAAYNGVAARLKDIRHEAVASGLAHARSLFDSAVRRRRLTRLEGDARMALVSGGLDYAGFGSVDLVVEAVVERMDVKKAVLAETEAAVPPHAVLTTNTSSLSVDEMAEALDRPGQFAGMHFFNPVHRMPLVEVVRGAATSDDTVETVAAFAAALGKIPVVTGDGPGFLVNRILGPYLNEAGYLLGEGLDGEAIDRIWKRWGMPMGPFRLIDEVGIDVMAHAGAALHQALGDRLEPAPALAAVAGSDRLGKKGGVGFYRYSDGKSAGFDPSVYEAIGAPGTRTKPDATMVTDRLFLTMVNEAARVLEEGVVETAGDVDLGMIMGTGFPPFRGGLMKHADDIGTSTVLESLERLVEAHGTRFAPCELLRKLGRREEPLYHAFPAVDR